MQNQTDGTLLELQALVEGGLALYHPSVKLVYLALWVRSRIDPRIYGLSSDEACSVTQEALACDLDLWRRTVQRVLRLLEAQGLIQAIAAGGGRAPATQRLSLPQEIRQMMSQRKNKAGPAIDEERDPKGGEEEKWGDRLTSDDPALLEALVEGISESERNELEQEVHQRLSALTMEPTAEQVARETTGLVMMRHFGPERLRRYWRQPF